ncbi:2-amino-3,7-dideoxy-D-threo-hept-6-ulosonate synthase [Phytohabitans suffuscus]|uniref:Fructose-bisphosphate aldolase n=1 Tax=Phytohabitans suffuscus TaxID=624315 RepID=A0A6F8YFD3_9ACTN|nr:2-amino-3,7-dideoxy-D-threo-hept-6-ulosonate synthase [Phytohabitans suffuscus]BCB84743.1 fructose-bisphosphate aldolase [Phytohabitans suffuscus]
MTVNNTLGGRIRLQHLYRHDPSSLFVVPLDHSVTDGPIARNGQLNRLIGQLAGNGVDAVVLHKGALRHVDAGWFRSLSLIVHLSASTRHAPDPDAKYLVSSVEEALRLGAHAVSVHVNVGSETEGRQIADLAAVAEAGDRWGVPLLAMLYPRGPQVADGRAPELVAHAATIAADLGADLVKSALPTSATGIAAVAASCPVPVLAAGGAPSPGPDGALRHLADAMRAGAGGIAAGRLVFTAPDPAATARRIAALVHDRTASTVLGGAR